MGSCLLSTRLWFGDEVVLGWYGSSHGGCLALWMSLVLLSYALKTAKMVNFML
jgi:hypothetical protein